MDHHVLWWILNVANATRKLGRRRLQLLESDLEIVQTAGVNHQAGNALSGIFTVPVDNNELEEQIPLMVVA